ncbi:MAG: hypothetical protein LAO23_04550 [Acidobacteriia bacterium]|nr:hypothetical protein [Terriglobia bacterium]
MSKLDAIGQHLTRVITADTPVKYNPETGEVSDDSGTIARLRVRTVRGRRAMRMTVHPIDYNIRTRTFTVTSPKDATEKLIL